MRLYAALIAVVAWAALAGQYYLITLGAAASSCSASTSSASSRSSATFWSRW
jgi:hypothetical protein